MPDIDLTPAGRARLREICEESKDGGGYYSIPNYEQAARLRTITESLPAALDRIDRLEAIVNRLPITEDGVRMLPGDPVYWRHGGWGTAPACPGLMKDRYSTEAAARAAKEKTDG